MPKYMHTLVSPMCSCHHGQLTKHDSVRRSRGALQHSVVFMMRQRVVSGMQVGGTEAALFDYARGGPQWGADALIIGPPQVIRLPVWQLTGSSSH